MHTLHATQPVHLVTVTDPNGKPCWFFVLSAPYRMRMLNARPDEQRSVHDYGTVVASGWGTEPDAATLYRMQREYGFVPTGNTLAEAA